MRQFVGSVRDDSTVRDLLLSVAPEPVREAAAEIDRTETLMMERDSEADQMAYAHALVDVGRRGRLRLRDAVGRLHRRSDRYAVRQGPVAQGHHPLGWGAEAGGPRGAAAGARGGAPARRAGQLPRRAGQALAGGAADRLAEDRAVREPRPRAAQPGGDAGRHPRARGAGSTLWVHPGRFATYHQAREDRNSRLEELRRRWDEEHQKIKDLVQMLKVKAKYNDGMAPRYHAAQTRLRKFEEAGPPQETPLRAERQHAAQGRSHRQACGHRRGTRADRPDEAVRPRDLVRRAGRGAREQRLGQVALPAAGRSRRQRPRRRAPPGRRHPARDR